MYRDSNRDLQWLDEALRDVEEPEEPLFPEDWEEEEEDPDSLFSESWYEELLPENNPAVDFGRTVYADEDTEPVPAGRNRASRLEQKHARREAASEKKKRKKKKKGIGGLVLLALAETAAIFYILRWWIIWLT